MSRGFNPGKYRQRIAFESATQAQNATSGAITLSWAAVQLNSNDSLASVPAECLTGPAREQRASGTTEVPTSLRVTCRWFPGLDSAWRIVWLGKAYDIKSIETDETGRREYRIDCSGGTGDGAA